MKGRLALSKKEHIIEMRCTSRESLLEYFAEIGWSSDGNGEFTGHGWEVLIGSEECCSLGSISIPSIKVIFYVEEELWRDISAAFNIRFLKAGG